MARRAEIAIVYLAGLGQGLALITFPAASNILTSPDFHGLTSSEYGSLFLPMIVCAILASSLGGALARTWTLKRVLLAGLAFDVVSMGLLAASAGFVAHHALAYGTLLVAMAALGAGFGATVTILNAYAAGFFPQRSDAALTGLHTFLGTGTALAPLLVAAFVRAGLWWALPLISGGGLLVLLGVALGQPLHVPGEEAPPETNLLEFVRRLGARPWVYLGVVVVYGIVETVFGSWATIYLHQEQGFSLDTANLGLAAFWAMVTVGRLAVTALSVRVPARWIYIGLPPLVLAAFLGIPRVGGATAAVLAFGFAGLACSAFLPLSISFGAREFSRMAELASGALMAGYMLGFGIGSFGVGPLRDWGGLAISTIYTGSGVVALVMATLAFLIVRAAPRPGSGP